jgi:hypothetical protein
MPVPDPWVPPYFGSWDRLVKYLVYEATHAGPDPVPWRTHLGPVPDPWRTDPSPTPWTPAVSALVAAVNAQQLAANVEEGSVRTQLEQSASASIAQVLDDYCGTPPRRIPWPFPGPPPWVFAIASELNAIANTATDAGMREGLLKVAGQVLQRGFGQAGSGTR